MFVSKRTVGPVGAGGATSCAMVEGASGSACCAAGADVAGESVVVAVAGGVVAPGVVDCAKAMAELRAIVQVRMRSAKFGVFIPC